MNYNKKSTQMVPMKVYADLDLAYNGNVYDGIATDNFNDLIEMMKFYNQNVKVKYVPLKVVEKFTPYNHLGKDYLYKISIDNISTNIQIMERVPSIYNDDEYTWKEGTENEMCTEFKEGDFEFRCTYRQKEDTLYIRVYYTKGVDYLKVKGRKRKIDTIEIDKPTNADIKKAIYQWTQEFINEVSKVGEVVV